MDDEDFISDFEPPENDIPLIEFPERDNVIPLGYDRGPVYFYYSASLKQTASLRPAEHSRTNLEGLASAPRYWENFDQFNSKHGFLWAQLAGYLMEECRKRGPYDPRRVRGTGAWMEGDQPIIHVGDALIVNGSRAGLVYPGSRYIYETTASLLPTIRPAASTQEAHWLIKVCRLLRWEIPAHGTLLAGWIAIAAICGALKWRPSVWLTGSSGSGKSWIMDHIVNAVLGEFALAVASTTTEAGIRQGLQCDARPVIFDEAEAESPQAVARLQSVLNLVRASASENSPDQLKGQTNQSRAKIFRIRSAFLFQSINVGLSQRADESRITVLSLRDHSTERDIGFDDLDATVRERITPEFGSALISRSVKLLPVIRANAETFARAIAVRLGNRRLGDQLGTLLAGAYSLHSEALISPETAAEYVSREEWADQAPEADEKDEFRLLRYLMAAKLRIGTSEMPVARLVEAAQAIQQAEGLPAPETAQRALSEAGIKYAPHENVHGLYFSTNHPALKRLLAGQPWENSWSRSLARIPQSVGGRKTLVRFAVGHVSRVVWLPMDVIDPPEP
jgi:putative DNA primase/helicase